jgi:pimeloyl-ACP methyl ester carboxylesterase
MPELPGVSHSFYEVRGVRTHVAEAGQGEPLVLLHGWPQNWWCWNKVIGPLAESGYRVIAPDMRGYGWSDPGPGGYDKQSLERDLIALLDVLELDRVQLIGHDWGAFIGFVACLEHPERIERFIALGIAPPFEELEPGDVLRLVRFAYQVPLAAPILGRLLVDLVPGFAGRIVRLASARADAFDDSDLQIYNQTLRADASVAIYRSFLLRDLPAVVAGRWSRRLTVPTRLMIGTREFLISPDELGGYEKYADDMDAEAIEGVGHFVPEEAPDDVIRLARSFLRPAKPSAAPAT